MQNGELYQRNNAMQRTDIKFVLDQYASRFRWRSDGQDSILDIGCGSGDALVDLLLPVLPRQYARVVGADISETMMRPARQKVLNPKVQFRILDVESATLASTDTWRTPFDHITSFFCLNWVQNMRQAMANVYNLLQPNGDCLLMSACTLPNYTLYPRLLENPRWAAYESHVRRCVPSSHNSTDPIGDLERIMKEVSFKEYDVQTIPRTFDFGDMENYKSFTRSIFPFADQLSDEQLDAAMDDIAQLVQNEHPEMLSPTGSVIISYNLLVVFARK